LNSGGGSITLPAMATGYMASVLTITEAKGSAKFLIKKNIVEPMAPVPLQPRQKGVFTASGDNRGQKAPPFGLTPICLGSKTEAE